MTAHADNQTRTHADNESNKGRVLRMSVTSRECRRTCDRTSQKWESTRLGRAAMRGILGAEDGTERLPRCFPDPSTPSQRPTVPTLPPSHQRTHGRAHASRYSLNPRFRHPHPPILWQPISRGRPLRQSGVRAPPTRTPTRQGAESQRALRATCLKTCGTKHFGCLSKAQTYTHTHARTHARPKPT